MNSDLTEQQRATLFGIDFTFGYLTALEGRSFALPCSSAEGYRRGYEQGAADLARRRGTSDARYK